VTSPRQLRALLAIAVAVAVAVGCAGADDEPTGSLRVAGSTTLLPMLSAIAGDYAAAHPLVNLDVEMTGTGDGFALFCDGMVDVTGASREMTARERETCIASGVQFLRLTVAHDAVVVFTKAELAQPACLTREQLYALLGPESTGIDRWEAADEVIPGSAAGLPAEAFVAIGPGESSGTKRLLVDLAIAPVAEERGREAALRPDYVAEPREQQIANRLAGSGSGLGFAGLARASQWGDRVRLLAVDGGEGCVAPDLADLRSGDYPLGRLLYLYVNVAAARTDPALRAFVDAVLSERGIATATAVGGVALATGDAEAQRAAWRRALAPEADG